MGWKRVQDEGGIQKWTAGMVVTGTLLERKENKLGPLIVVSTENGPATYGCPTVLAKKLVNVEIGALVRIACGGKVVGESGTPYWTFDVDVADADEAAAAPVDPRDADIPF